MFKNFFQPKTPKLFDAKEKSGGNSNSSGITGNGTVDYIPVWTSPTSLGDSPIKKTAGLFGDGAVVDEGVFFGFDSSATTGLVYNLGGSTDAFAMYNDNGGNVLKLRDDGIAELQLATTGAFLVGASSQTSAAERFQIKTSVDKYGWIHTDGNVRGGSYISLAGIWLGTHSNHSLSIFTNDGAAQAVFNTDGSFAVAGVVKADSHNTRDLGTSTRAWKDLYLSGTITFEGSTDDSFETTLTVADPTADRTITLPNATGTVALESAVNVTYTNITSITVTNGIVTAITGT